MTQGRARTADGAAGGAADGAAFAGPRSGMEVEPVDDRGDKGVEVAAGDREAAARLQAAARAAGHLLAAVGAGLVWAVGPFEKGRAAVVDGEAAFDGEVELDLVSWTRGRILGVAEAAVAEVAAELLAEGRADPAAGLGQYIREDVRGGGRGRSAGVGGVGAGGGKGVRRPGRRLGRETAARPGGAAERSGVEDDEPAVRSGGGGRVFLTTEQAAELVGLSPRTLEKMRVEGGGPVFHKLGRRVVY